VNFQESESYLLSLGNEVSAMKLGLENIRKLLAALGDPHENYLKVQVAGTNGKGSVCSFLDAICLSAGIRTGLYTSPHLISITERIKINGEEISRDDFARTATRVRETAEKLKGSGEFETVPTFFEQVTAIALIAFAEAGIELATTAANAAIAAITPIDYDHQEYLGESLEEIAAEKAAIIRENMEVVIAQQRPEAMSVILRRCRSLGITPMQAATAVTGRRECETAPLHTSVRESETAPPAYTFRTSANVLAGVTLGLAGRHQEENAKVAILLAEILQRHFTISPENMARGLETARHPGRLEYYKGILFDGAHNTAGASALRDHLDEFV
jgi:dihydrofolate synthase / folylpolyglutamate synthase